MINVGDWPLVRQLAPQRGAHFPQPASSSADGWFQTENAELHLQCKSNQAITVQLIVEEFTKINTNTPRGITFAILGLGVDKTIEELKSLNPKPEEVCTSSEFTCCFLLTLSGGELLALRFPPQYIFSNFHFQASMEQEEQDYEIQTDSGKKKRKKTSKNNKKDKKQKEFQIPQNADILVLTKAGFEEIVTQDVAKIVFETMRTGATMYRTPSVLPVRLLALRSNFFPAYLQRHSYSGRNE